MDEGEPLPGRVDQHDLVQKVAPERATCHIKGRLESLGMQRPRYPNIRSSNHGRQTMRRSGNRSWTGSGAGSQFSTALCSGACALTSEGTGRGVVSGRSPR